MAQGQSDRSGSQFSLPRLGADPGHLTTEAVAAYVDGELSKNSHLRAGAHLARCPQCRAAVETQRQARAALKDAHCPAAPDSLLAELGRIPECADPPDVADPADPGPVRRRWWKR